MRDPLQLLQAMGWSAVSLGMIPGMSIVTKAGRNPAANAGEDIWGGSSTYLGFPVGNVGELVEVFSSNAGDVGTLTISGLDENWAPQSETFALNGTTPISSTKLWQRVHTANFSKTGSNTAFNLGTITCRHKTTTANVFFQMPIGRSQTQVMGYTVPDGSKALILHISAAIRRGTQGGGLQAVAGDFDIWQRDFGKSPRLRRAYLAEGGMRFDSFVEGGLLMPAKTDFTARVSSITATDQDVVVRMDLLVVEDSFLEYL